MITTRDSRVDKTIQKTTETRQWEANWKELHRLGAGIHPMPSFEGDNDRFFYNALPDGSWKGRRCFIVAGGPSLRGFDFSQLQGELTIGVNYAFNKIDCTIMFFMDNHCYQWIVSGDGGAELKQRFREFKGFKLCLYITRFNYPKEIYLLNCIGSAVLSDSMRRGLGSGTNSGFAALNLAVCLGANPIYLLGYDMSIDREGRQHWWGVDYARLRSNTNQQRLYGRFARDFDEVAPELKSRGIRVVNLNPKSNLRCFEFGKFSDIRKESKNGPKKV